jgi:hypothetical protein
MERGADNIDINIENYRDKSSVAIDLKIVEIGRYKAHSKPSLLAFSARAEGLYRVVDSLSN